MTLGKPGSPRTTALCLAAAALVTACGLGLVFATRPLPPDDAFRARLFGYDELKARLRR
jgi:hypothetical protein